MQKRWTVQTHDKARAIDFGKELGLSPLCAAILISRGHDSLESASAFLNPCLDHLHDPILMLGLDKACDRIFKAVQNHEKVLVWGDYDVDGTTGTVLLRSVFKMIGLESGYHIPNRFTEGYGVNRPALEQAKQDGYSLVITVDCGIRSFEPLEWAHENGLDVIVTDHHLSDEVNGNPPAYAIVNPNQPGCGYPDKHLAGVGVAFKLAHELLRRAGKESFVPSFLKVAAIGTIADIMKLTGENRAIVSIGLKDLLGTRNYGLKALMEVADCRSDMTSYHIGFRIAPRINAAGRMDVAKHVVELFEATSFDEARRLAELLDTKNRERQQIQQKITELALLQSKDIDKHDFVVVAGDDWHKGVVGLAASRIAEQFHRPTIVLTIKDGIASGSARSISDFHLLNALESCSDLFEQFGGHAAAAGMTIKAENIDHLRSRLNKHCLEYLLDEHRTPQLRIDAEVSSRTMTLSLLNELSRLEPFGAGNPKPIFLTKNLVLTDQPFIMKDKHLKMFLSDGNGKTFEAVWWDGVRKFNGQTLKPKASIELAYSPEANTWQGTTRLQLVVEDLRANNYN
jgi:single-stranded-DNA-specific exonuclease